MLLTNTRVAFKRLQKMLDKSTEGVIISLFSLLNLFLLIMSYRLLNKFLFILFSEGFGAGGDEPWLKC